MTASSLRNQRCKELSQMARAMGLPGWHSMRKDELVKALANHARRKTKGSSSGAATAAMSHGDARSSGNPTRLTATE